MKRAIVFGASGFVGSYLLHGLLDNQEYEEVTAVVRKSLKISHPKLRTLVGDYNSLTSLKSEISSVAEVFITLGTTRKNAPKKADYYQVDHDYPVLAAQIAKEKGAKSVFLLTAIGANPSSRFFYVKTKGEAERDIIFLDFERTHIFRPSMIMGARKEKRLLEGALIKLWPVINPLFVGKLDKYKGITGEDIAHAMIASSKSSGVKVRIYHWREMHKLLHG